MKFDLDNLNPGSWFDFGDARVCVRVCAGKDLEKIQKKTRKRRTEYRRGQRYAWEDVNEDQEFKMIFDYAILDWENINDANGVALVCNTTNKMLLLNGSPEFNTFIGRCLEQLTTDLNQIEEEEEKNSSSG
jgi:hypothetical protein